MSLNWFDASAVVTGLILDHRIGINEVRPEIFAEPYNRAIKLLQKDPNLQIEDLIQYEGLSPIWNAFEQVHKLNGLGEKNWVQILEKTALLYDIGTKGGRLCQKMVQGEIIDLAEFKGMLNNLEQAQLGEYVKLSDVKDEELAFLPTGWENIDEHLGGLPESGMIIIGGLPGIGKTTAVGRLAGSFVKTHREKNVAIFSLEMLSQELGPRLKQLIRLNDSEKERILIFDKPYSVPEIINHAASIDDLGLVVIDFIDLAIDGVIDVQSTTLAYTQIAKAAKQLHVPIVVIVQLNDLVGMPKPRNIRFSRLAWGLAWMILMLYDPSVNWSNDSDDDRKLPAIEGKAYIIAWKIRGGFRKHQNESPGAIQMGFNGRHGWQPNEGRWYSLKEVT